MRTKKQMMRMAALVAAGCTITAAAKAQYLQLVATGSLPVVATKVILTPAIRGGKEITLVTDSAGRVRLPEAGYPYRLAVQNMSYEPVRDSISKPYDKVIWLEPRAMGEIVITGQYATTTADKAVQRVEVIDRKKIDAMAAQNLRDVLTNQLEIRMDYDPIFGTSMNMQGSRNYSPDAKILIDGVPVVGKQDGAVDLSQINLANVERIEIIKGPMSVSYGSDAIAGTVNLITRKTVKNGGEAYAGTYCETTGTYNINAGGGFQPARAHSIRVDAFRNFFGGWNPGAPAGFFDFNARLADTSRVMLWKPREQYQGTLQYIYTHGRTTVNYKGSYFYELITNRGVPLAPYYELAFDNRFHTWRKDNAVFVNSALGKGMQLNVFAAYNAYKRIKTEVANDLTTLTETRDPDLQDTSRYEELNSRGVLTSGNTGGKLDYEAGYDVNIQYANSTQIEERYQEMGNYAVYGSMEYRPTEQLTIRPGLRYGYNTRYTAPLVPSLNLMYRAGHNVTFRASYARGFRQPGLKELYFDLVDINHNIHGNPGLKAEYSNNYLASVSYSGRHNNVTYKASASAYYNKAHDLIRLALKANGGASEYWYVNISEFATKGLQANAEITAGSLNLSAGASYMGTYNQLSEEQDLPAFSYSPEVRGSLTYNFKAQGLSVSAFYKYTGRFVQYIVDRAGEVVQSQMANYSIADVTVSKQLFRKRLYISAGCKNLFGVSNILTGPVSGGAHSGDGGTAAIGMGRYYFMKADIKISK